MIYRKVSTVLFEGLVIGCFSIVLFLLLSLIPILNRNLFVYIKIFLIGFIMHILFEYLTLNYRWCNSVYSKI